VLRLFDKDKLETSAVDLGFTPGTCHAIPPSLIILAISGGTNFLNLKSVFRIQNDLPFDLRVIDIRSTKARVIIAVFITSIDDTNVCASTQAWIINPCASDRILVAFEFKSAWANILRILGIL
jgi:hypothetical protein